MAFAPDVQARTRADYVETAPRRGFLLLTRPKKRNAADQWTYVQRLDREGRTRVAARQAHALRLFWPHSPEAPAAQILYARLMERRNRPQEAFKAYQHLVETYPGRFEFNDVIERQFDLAKTIMERRKGKVLFLPGFSAPERAIPLLEQIVANAPEWPAAAEVFYWIGYANERKYEYAAAIDAYLTVLNRFPQSEFAEKSALAQIRCYEQLLRDSPQDNRLLDTTMAACNFFLQRFPASEHRDDVLATRENLAERQSGLAYARARYYDRILRNPASALIEYRSALERFPAAREAPEARQRLAELERSSSDPSSRPSRRSRRSPPPEAGDSP